MYAEGHGVPQDYPEAVRWFRKAADQGNATAQGNLGDCYGNGNGVIKDYVQAYKWDNLASAQGLVHYPARSATFLNFRVIGAIQVAEAQRLAREFKPTKPAEAAPFIPSAP